MAAFIFDGDVAKDVGVKAAVLYWNIEWWVRKNEANGTNLHDGKYWTYNSREAFSRLFGFMSPDAIKRALKKLRDKGYIEMGEFNESPYDRTRWYTVKRTDGLGADAPVSLGENAPVSLGEIAQSYICTDINTDVNTDVNDMHSPESAEAPKESIPYKEIVSYLNEKAGTAYRASSSKTRTLIHARWTEGFRPEDFRRVIDTKCSEWLHDPRMSKFIRPETLFGTKFEGYLNTPGKQAPDFSAYDNAGEVLEIGS